MPEINDAYHQELTYSTTNATIKAERSGRFIHVENTHNKL